MHDNHKNKRCRQVYWKICMFIKCNLYFMYLYTIHKNEIVKYNVKMSSSHLHEQKIFSLNKFTLFHHRKPNNS